jgi:hypothetical protein
MVSAQLKELLLQSLEHERGGVLVYETALKCVVNRQLHEEWMDPIPESDPPARRGSDPRARD